MTTQSNIFELNADLRIYLIKFAWTSRNGKFLTNDLAKTIKEHDPERGIEYIKTFDPVKNIFTRISKSEILRFHNWDTEATETLKKHQYFK